MAMTSAQFQAQLCSEVSTLLQGCSSGSLRFDVNAYPSGFAAASNSSPPDGSGNLPTLATFNLGNACGVVLVRAFYKWPIFTPGLQYFMAIMAGSYHLLTSAAAFRNELYSSTMSGCC